MSVRLKSFEYLPRGPEGWGSGLLQFGDMFTAVQGANGTGKTPIMKGVMSGLGHEVELPPDVLERCEFAQTTLEVDGRPVTLTRRCAPDFEIIADGDRDQLTFTNQADFAKWFIRLFSGEPPTLTTKQSQPAELYANVLLPALWVDQDHGWTTDYWTPPNRNFIKGQRQEVIRFLVGVPPRHSFRSRTAYDTAKEALERIEQAIEMQRYIVERLRTSEQLLDEEEPILLERGSRLRRELDSNGEIIEAVRSATAGFDRKISALEAQRDELSSRRGVLMKRKAQLSLVLSELDGEEDILTANVQATDLLRQFCGREGCESQSPCRAVAAHQTLV